MNNAVFEKTMEKARKLRDLKLVRAEIRRNCLVSELSYHTTKNFSMENGKMEMKKKSKWKDMILMNKASYLGPSILKIRKIVIYNFWYDYAKIKYGEKAQFCYRETGNFKIYIKTEDI